MKICHYLSASLLVFASTVQAQFWSSNNTPVSDTLVGFDAASPDFAIAVGRGGQIVHFENGNNGTVVPSGTSFDLFDVRVVDRDFAIASGENVVLFWDGGNWSVITENTDLGNPIFYTPVWATPEKDRVYYQNLDTSGFGFDVICPWLPDDPDAFLFCRVVDAIISMCGISADVKAVSTNGSIRRFSGGTLSNLDDPMDQPIFEQPAMSPLNLIAAYVPPESCIPGNHPPTEILAIHQSGPDSSEFWRFDGAAWSKQGDAAPGQLLTGMAGTGTAQVIAVGNQAPPAPGPNNVGVAWVYDGSSWQQETLPLNTTGLTDVAFTLSYSDQIFAHGFESAVVVAKGLGGPGVSGGFSAVGEGGVLHNRPVIEIPVADLSLLKSLVNPIPPLSTGNPVKVGDVITYALQVTNLGPREVPSAIVNDVYFNAQLAFVDSDCPASITDQGTRSTASFGLTNLQPGQMITCRPRFQVLSIPLQQSGAAGVLNVAEVRGSIADPNPSNNTKACLIDNNEAGSDGTRVQCEINDIFILVP